jgi:tetratricopeptide (TPR) repeat protein
LVERKGRTGERSQSRWPGVFRALAGATSLVLILAVLGCVLYVRVPGFRRRVNSIPVRIHRLRVERQRRDHPPTIPPPVLSSLPTDAPAAQTPVAPTATREALPGSATPVEAETHLPSPPSPGATGVRATGVHATGVHATGVRAGAVSTAPPAPLPASSRPSPTPRASPTPKPLPTATPAHTSVYLDGVRHVWQDWNNCGPATFSMALSYYGRSETQYDVQQAVRPNKWDLNVSPHELAAYARSLGLEALVRQGGRRDLIARFLESGIPVMLELWYYPDEHGGGHYRLIVGYDETTQEWISYDVQLGPGYRVSYAQQDQEWQAFDRLYVIVHRSEQAELVQGIVGEEMDDTIMHQHALATALAERDANPDNAFAWFNAGTDDTALGRYEEAAEAYDRARILGLPFRMLWYQFGPFEAYLALGRYQDAIDLATANLNMVGNQEESHYYLGRARQALGDLEAARRCYQEALRYHPGFAPAAEALAGLE